MHTCTFTTFAILALAAFGHAKPFHLDEVKNDVESWTSVVNSVYAQATAEAASYYTDGLSAASVGIQEVRSDASTWLAAHTSGGVFATATSIGGVAESIVTSVGGPAITLAASNGVLTSFAGSGFTAAAGSTGSANAAVNVHSMTLTTPPVLTALITVVGGTLLGAWLVC